MLELNLKRLIKINLRIDSEIIEVPVALPFLTARREHAVSCGRHRAHSSPRAHPPTLYGKQIMNASLKDWSKV